MSKKVCIIVMFVAVFVISLVAVLRVVELGDKKVFAESHVGTSCSENSSTFEEWWIDVTPSNTDDFILDSKSESYEEYIENSYSEDDLFYLAAAICREAGAETEEAQLLVANVIMNRVNSELYPDTIYDVLTQYRQYGTMWKDGISFPEWANQKTIKECYASAKRVLSGERFCPENVLFQAEFLQGSGVYKEIDGIYFCFYE